MLVSRGLECGTAGELVRCCGRCRLANSAVRQLVRCALQALDVHIGLVFSDVSRACNAQRTS